MLGQDAKGIEKATVMINTPTINGFDSKGEIADLD